MHRPNAASPTLWAGLAVLLGLFLLLWGYGRNCPRLPDPPPAVFAAADLNANGRTESYRLDKHTLWVAEEGMPLWHTPPEWQVQEFLLADIDGRGKPELLLLVWKQGSFGRSRPFWQQFRDYSWGCHLFLLQLQRDRFHPFWFSSALPSGISRLQTKTAPNEPPRLVVVVQGGGWQSWQWDGWGFKCLDSALPGHGLE